MSKNQKQHPFQCVLFDVDGTLFDTLDDLTRSVNLALSECGYPTHCDETVKSFVNNGAFLLIERALPEDARDQETVRRVLKRYLELYFDHLVEQTKPYPGMVALCEDLKKAGVLLGVVTNKPDAHAKRLCETVFGQGFFPYIAGSGDGLPTKPEPECVGRALAYFQVSPEETLFVGDSAVDVATARNGAVRSAGVLWGFGGQNSFTNAPPDYLIHNASQLKKLILGNPSKTQEATT